MAIRQDDELLDGTYGTTSPILPNNEITAERHRDIVESKVSRYSIENPDDTTPEGELILANTAYQAAQDSRLDDLESKVTQIRTTIGITGLPDSDIFNSDVISKADLLWTKYEHPEGNLVSINGEFITKNAQSTSYGNLFWKTPDGFEIMDTSVIVGQFVELMQYTILASASLNSLITVNGELGWSNYGVVPIGNYTIHKTLRAE